MLTFVNPENISKPEWVQSNRMKVPLRFNLFTVNGSLIYRIQTFNDKLGMNIQGHLYQH